jgi:hypothetical protein
MPARPHELVLHVARRRAVNLSRQIPLSPAATDNDLAIGDIDVGRGQCQIEPKTAIDQKLPALWIAAAQGQK